MSTFLAVDFGAGSGRVIAGRVSGGQLGLDELHRFPNRQVRLGGHVYWDFPALFEEMKEGLRRAAAKYADVESIGIDTWGCGLRVGGQGRQSDGESFVLP